MSSEATDSTTLTAEQNEVVQESSQSSNEGSEVEVLTDVDEPQVNAEDGIGSSGSSTADDTSDESVIPDESTRSPSSLQDTVAIDDTDMQDSQKKISDGVNTKSQQGDSLQGTESQQGPASYSIDSQQGPDSGFTESPQYRAGDVTESPQDPTGYSTDSQKDPASDGTEPSQETVGDSIDSEKGPASDSTESPRGPGSEGAESPRGPAIAVAESQPGPASTVAESQRGGASGGVSGQLIMESASLVGNSCAESLRGLYSFTDSRLPFEVFDASRQDLKGSFIGDLQGAAFCASSLQASLESGVAGDISNSPDLQDSVSTGYSPFEDSHEAAAVCSSSRRGSVESGAAGDSTNGPELQNNFVDGGSNTGDSQEAVFGSGRGVSQEGGNAGDISNRPDVQGNFATGRSNTGDSQEAVCGSGRGASLEGDNSGDISNRPNVQDSVATSDSGTGDSQETAFVVDSSLESGAHGDISHSPNSTLSPSSAESVDGPLVNVYPPAPVPMARLPWWSSESEQEEEDSPRSYNQCFCKCAFICDYLRPCSRRIRKSEIFRYIRKLVIVIALIVTVMGLGNLFHCPARSALPILVSLLGITGIILLVANLAMDNRRLHCPNVRRGYLTAGMVIARLIFLGLFGAVLNFTYTTSPSFDRDNQENYCDEMFYHFAYYANFVIAGIVLAFFIYVPSINDDSIHYERI